MIRLPSSLGISLPNKGRIDGCLQITRTAKRICRIEAGYLSVMFMEQKLGTERIFYRGMGVYNE
jgi:hypothetical protein